MGDLSMENAPDKSVVLVTGFGPFGSHTVNSSWLGVQELVGLSLPDNIELITCEIPVEYSTVSSLVPKLWKEHKPKLVIHVGVSGIAREITLEQQAHNDGYDKVDACGCLHSSSCCVTDAPACIRSRLDMERVKQYINENSTVAAMVSHDPGRYLCDFIYYTSLNINDTCTAFIHVPPLNKPYSAQQLAEGIRAAIISMMQQIEQAELPQCSSHMPTSLQQIS